MDTLQIALNQVHTDAWFDIFYTILGIFFCICFFQISASDEDSTIKGIGGVIAFILCAFSICTLRDCMGEFTNPHFYAVKYINKQLKEIKHVNSTKKTEEEPLAE